MNIKQMVQTISGKVKNVRKDRKGLELDNGSWYSYRADTIRDGINRGDTVTITYNVNGTYNNIETIDKTSSSPSGSSPSGYQSRAEQNPALQLMNGVFALTCKYIELQGKLAEINKELPESDISAFVTMATGLTADAYLNMKRHIDNDGLVPTTAGEGELHPAA